MTHCISQISTKRPIPKHVNIIKWISLSETFPKHPRSLTSYIYIWYITNCKHIWTHNPVLIHCGILNTQWHTHSLTFAPKGTEFPHLLDPRIHSLQKHLPSTLTHTIPLSQRTKLLILLCFCFCCHTYPPPPTLSPTPAACLYWLCAAHRPICLCVCVCAMKWVNV